MNDQLLEAEGVMVRLNAECLPVEPLENRIQVGVACEEGADRRTEALAQAQGEGNGRPRQAGRVLIQGHRRVEQPRPVDVQQQPVIVNEPAHLVHVRQRQSAAA